MSNWIAYRVKPGDHIERLAFKAGVLANEVWQHEKNEPLRKRRKNQNALAEGDMLFLPAERPAGADITAGTKNKYICSIPTVRIAIQVQCDERELKNQPYEATLTGPVAVKPKQPIKGTVGDKGQIEVDVPVLAREISFTFPEAAVRLELVIGALDPIEEETGIIQRLCNLGYLADQNPSIQVFESAVASFQKDHGINATGWMDDETRQKIEDTHKS